MKGKKQRRNSNPNSSQPKHLKREEPPLTKIKFNLSMDNLSCFMGSRNSIKKCLRKVS